MINSPLVTVYITNYNYGSFIKEAIESVLNQSFQDFEIIIIDDGSTDNSKSIIESYSGHQKIKIIFQQNKGLNITNNIALRVAQGKYIMRLDADDYLDKNALLVMTNILEKDESLGLVFPDYYIVDVKGEILSLEKRHNFDKDVSLLDQPAHGACTMIRKKFLQMIGGYDEQYRCQDGYELWIKFTSKFKVTNTDTALFFYRRHGSNLTTNENRILDTRALIKNNYVEKNISTTGSEILIIPIRGSKHKGTDIGLLPLGNKKTIDWLVNEALLAQRISKVIVSSPSEDIKKHLNKHYNNNPKIIFHQRDESLARLNKPLNETLFQIMDLPEIKNINPNILVIRSIEYPFVKCTTIDDFINSMYIFKTDSMISVREENITFFQHDGSGMKPILNQEKFSKLEREAIYKHAGGVTAVTIDHLRKGEKLISGKVGHIVIDQRSSLGLKTNLDRKIAELLIRSEENK